MSNNLTAIQGMVSSLLGESDLTELQPAHLDQAYTAWSGIHRRGEEDPNPIINAFGIGFGQCLVDRLALAWKIVEDQSGTDIAVYGTPGEIMIFPTNLVAKRYERQETGFFVPLFEDIEKQVDEVRRTGS